jgi:lipoprotein-releasing system permease protein
MYQLTLILKYLCRKLAPLFGAIAVTLCTMMVIIVMSVMGGFLDLMKTAAQKLTGDVIIASDYRGFPHYEELIADLKKLPQVAAVTAVVRAPGMAKFTDPFGEEHVHLVQVIGVHGHEMDHITGLGSAIYWSSADELARFNRGVDVGDAPLSPQTTQLIEQMRSAITAADLRERGLSFEVPSGWRGDDVPPDHGIVPGIQVNPWSRHNDQGKYDYDYAALGTPATLTVVPMTAAGGATETSSAKFIKVNEFKSGLYDADANQVFVKFQVLQAMLKMDEGNEADPDTGQPTGKTTPARTSEVVLKGAPGYPLAQVEEVVRLALSDFRARHQDEDFTLYALTWMQRHADLLNAVQNEKGLVTFLFAVISIVAVLLIALVFYNTVLQKTRDIGVLRALGASRTGVASIFLGYGLAVGVVGALAGLGLAVLIVTNLNPIQDFIFNLTGWRMWNPQVYYFDRIPDRVEIFDAICVVIAGILAGLVGALVPAFTAARQNPVESLRYE